MDTHHRRHQQDAQKEVHLDSTDRALADALRALHQEALDEPIPQPLLAAAHAAARAHERSTQWWRWGGVAAAVMLSFGLGWFMRGGAMPANSMANVTLAAQFAKQAQLAHLVYSPEVKHPVEVAAEQQDHLVQWLSKRLGRPLKVPQLHEQGFDLMGGRLLPGGEGARAQFMFENAGGERLTLYIGAVSAAHAQANQSETAFSYADQGSVPAFYWIDQGFGYALSGKLERAQLLKLAESVYRQL